MSAMARSSGPEPEILFEQKGKRAIVEQAVGVLARHRAQHYDCNSCRRRIALQRFQHIGAGHFWQQQIEHDQVGQFFFRHLEHLLAVGGGAYFESCPNQRSLCSQTQEFAVFYQQYSNHIREIFLFS